MMKLKDGDYSLAFDENASTIVFQGSSRLSNLSEYEEIKNFLFDAAKKVMGVLVLDLRELRFLNSSGITTLSMFVIQLRKEQRIKLQVLGSKSISWQERSIHNLKKLWADVEINVDD